MRIKLGRVFNNWCDGAFAATTFVLLVTAMNPGALDTGGVWHWTTFLGIAMTGCVNAALEALSRHG